METIVLIPAYNEEKTIRDVITLVKKIRLTPLVVDDGSTDDTNRIAKKSGAIVVKHKRNKGKGQALKTGFEYISENHPETKYVVIIDADSQYDATEATRLLIPLKNREADYVTGYRNWKTVPFRHKVGNFVWRTSFNLLFGMNLKDTNCGYIAMTRKAMLFLKKKIYGGFIIENAMLSEAVKNNLKIKQVPVTVHYHEIRDIPGGSRMVFGVLLFIIKRGLKDRFGIG